MMEVFWKLVPVRQTQLGGHTFHNSIIQGIHTDIWAAIHLDCQWIWSLDNYRVLPNQLPLVRLKFENVPMVILLLLLLASTHIASLTNSCNWSKNINTSPVTAQSAFVHGQSCCKLDCGCLLTGLQVYCMHYLLSQSHSAQVGLDQLNCEPYIMKVEGILHLTSLASCVVNTWWTCMTSVPDYL